MNWSTWGNEFMQYFIDTSVASTLSIQLKFNLFSFPRMISRKRVYTIFSRRLFLSMIVFLLWVNWKRTNSSNNLFIGVNVTAVKSNIGFIINIFGNIGEIQHDGSFVRKTFLSWFRDYFSMTVMTVIVYSYRVCNILIVYFVLPTFWL
jgi:hypothetical protein